MSGLDRLGIVQVEGRALVENFKMTASQIHLYDTPTMRVMETIEASVGSSQQADVAKLRELAATSLKSNVECGNVLASCAEHLRAALDAAS